LKLYANDSFGLQRSGNYHRLSHTAQVVVFQNKSFLIIIDSYASAELTMIIRFSAKYSFPQMYKFTKTF